MLEKKNNLDLFKGDLTIAENVSKLMNTGKYISIRILKNGLLLKGTNHSLGYANLEGTEIVPCDYDEVFEKDEYIIVVKGIKKGAYDEKGNMVFELTSKELKLPSGFIFS